MTDATVLGVASGYGSRGHWKAVTVLEGHPVFCVVVRNQSP